MTLFLVALLFGLPQQLSLPEFVDRVSDTYGKLNDFSADFEQILQDSSNQTSHQWGHVYLKSGKRARFEYLRPEQVSEYFDGKTYTRYTPPPVGQAIRTPIRKADAERLAILQVVGNRESPWKNQFERQEIPVDSPLIPGNRVVKLIPRNKDLRDVLIEANPRTFLIHRLVFTYVDGQRNEFRFTDIKTTSLDPALFRFKAPPGVEVIEQ